MNVRLAPGPELLFSTMFESMQPGARQIVKQGNSPASQGPVAQPYLQHALLPSGAPLAEQQALADASAAGALQAGGRGAGRQPNRQEAGAWCVEEHSVRGQQREGAVAATLVQRRARSRRAWSSGLRGLGYKRDDSSKKFGVPPGSLALGKANAHPSWKGVGEAGESWGAGVYNAGVEAARHAGLQRAWIGKRVRRMPGRRQGWEGAQQPACQFPPPPSGGQQAGVPRSRRSTCTCGT